MHDLIIDFNK